MSILDLNWNPFKSMHGGETNAAGTEHTSRGKEDFFAPFWSDRSEKEYKRFFDGDYKWDDYLLNPSSVIANPAQQIADPATYNEMKKGRLPQRTQASALIAALIYGGSSLMGGASNAGSSGSSIGGNGGGLAGTGSSGSGVGGSAFLDYGGGQGIGDLTAGFGDLNASPSSFSWMDLLKQQGSNGNNQQQEQRDQPVQSGGPTPAANDNSMGIDPTVLAMIADKVGSNLAPNNAFAGIATSLAQSKRADSARAAQASEGDDTMQALVSALSGENQAINTQQSSTDSQGNPTTPETQVVSKSGYLSPPGEPGPENVTIKTNKDGSVTSNVTSTVSAPPQAPAPQKPTSVNYSDLAPFLKAIQTPQGGRGSLMGLSPEQINQIAARDQNISAFKMNALKALGDINLQKAQRNYYDEKTRVEGATVDSTNHANQMLALQRQMAALKDQAEMIMQADMHPLEKQKLLTDISKEQALTKQAFAETSKKYAETAGITQDTQLEADLHPLVRDKTKSEASENWANAAKNNQATAIEGERQDILGKLASGDVKLNDLNLGTLLKVLGSGSTQDFTTGQATDARVRELEGGKQNFDKHQKAYAALDRAQKEGGSSADVNEWNSSSPDDATFGLVWTGETEFFDGISDNVPEQVTLPSGYTMGDVRHSAKIRNMTVDQVLKTIWEKGQ